MGCSSVTESFLGDACPGCNVLCFSKTKIFDRPVDVKFEKPESHTRKDYRARKIDFVEPTVDWSNCNPLFPNFRRLRLVKWRHLSVGLSDISRKKMIQKFGVPWNRIIIFQHKTFCCKINPTWFTIGEVCVQSASASDIYLPDQVLKIR